MQRANEVLDRRQADRAAFTMPRSTWVQQPARRFAQQSQELGGIGRMRIHAHPGNFVSRRGTLFAVLPQQHRLAITGGSLRSEEHTSELQSLMRISYAVFCLKTKNTQTHNKK